MIPCAWVATWWALALVTVAERQNVAKKDGRFSLPVVRVPEDDIALQTRDDDGERTRIEVDSTYLINATIGTPPQSFLFLGDTGSINLAVGSVLVPKDQQSSSPKYDPGASSSAHQMDGYTYRSCFASGYCSEGVVYEDVFTVGDIVVEKQNIGVQTNNSALGSGARSGTLGLNFGKNGMSTKPDRLSSWLETIMPRLDSALFTVDYNNNTGNGTIDFGYIDESKYTGDIGYAPVNQTVGGGEWTIKIDGIELSNGQMATSDHDWFVTVDTGTASAGLPHDVAATYFQQIKGAVYDKRTQHYTFPCSSDLVDFTFTIGGSSRFTIPASHTSAKSIDDGTTCVSLFKINQGDGTCIWGRAFLEEFFVVFDWDNARMGFANKATNASSSPSTSTSTSTPSTGTTTDVTSPSSTSDQEDDDSGGNAKIRPASFVALWGCLLAAIAWQSFL